MPVPRKQTTDDIIREAEEAGASAPSGSQPSFFDIAYLAGIIDGEGCIMVAGLGNKKHPQYQLRVTVAGTSLDLMLYLTRVFGARLTRVKRYSANWKPGFSAMWYCGNAKQVIHLVYPYLRVKRKQAEIALKWPVDHSRCPEVREMMYHELRELNCKGNTPYRKE